MLGVIACSLGSCSDNAQREKLYYSEVKSVNKLVLAQMTVSKMATIDDINLSDAEGLKQTAAALLDAVKLGNLTHTILICALSSTSPPSPPRT